MSLNRWGCSNSALDTGTLRTALHSSRPTSVLSVGAISLIETAKREKEIRRRVVKTTDEASSRPKRGIIARDEFGTSWFIGLGAVVEYSRGAIRRFRYLSVFGSMDHRNTDTENIRWCLPVRCFSRTGVELLGHSVKLGLRECRKIGSFWIVLPQQTIGIFVDSKFANFSVVSSKRKSSGDRVRLWLTYSTHQQAAGASGSGATAWALWAIMRLRLGGYCVTVQNGQ